jgi:transcriptional regulator NrdR family protein
MQNYKKDDDNMNSNNKVIPIDSSKYLEIYQFNEFKNSVSKEFERVQYSINELNRLIEEILMQLKSKVSDIDLRNLEEYLMTKLEELKSACNKKFADKNETSKNLKYLDQQIKHIIDVYIKKSEKSDNWLLAKKPLGGNSCASCETYIGELQDNNQFVPWNKYPMRDPNDKLYRIGNGFSKMLQMINVDNGSAGTPNLQPHKLRPLQTTSEFYKAVDPSLDGRKKDINLPRVINNKHKELNMSADDAEINELDDIEDPMQPKM